MIILGIDPGLATVGYGVVDKSPKGLRVVDYGVITTPPNEGTPVRLAMIADGLTALVEKHRPDCVVVEELFFNTNTTTGIRVAEARGVILYRAVMECGELFEYTPLQIKYALTGNGRADKKQMQFMVRAILGLTEIPKPDDAADALAVAICHANTSEHGHRKAK